MSAEVGGGKQEGETQAESKQCSNFCKVTNAILVIVILLGGYELFRLRKYEVDTQLALRDIRLTAGTSFPAPRMTYTHWKKVVEGLPWDGTSHTQDDLNRIAAAVSKYYSTGFQGVLDSAAEDKTRLGNQDDDPVNLEELREIVARFRGLQAEHVELKSKLLLKSFFHQIQVASKVPNSPEK